MRQEMLAAREMRPMDRYDIGGMARMRLVAAEGKALWRKLGPGLERRYGEGQSYQFVFDDAGHVVDFRPAGGSRVAALTGRRGKTLAECLAIQRASDARFRRLSMQPGRKTIAEAQREQDRRMAGWRR